MTKPYDGRLMGRCSADWEISGPVSQIGLTNEISTVKLQALRHTYAGRPKNYWKSGKQSESIVDNVCKS